MLRRIDKRCVICSQVYEMEEFKSVETDKITKVCRYCQRLGSEGQEERKRGLYEHLWVRSDGTRMMDPWEVVDDGQKHKCRVCKKFKEVKEFNLSGGKHNPRLTKTCAICFKKNVT